MHLMIYLFLTTLFWGMAAIFDKLALGEDKPLCGYDGSPIHSERNPPCSGNRQRPAGKLRDSGRAHHFLLWVEWNLRRSGRTLDLLPCPAIGWSLFGGAHYRYLSLNHGHIELADIAGGFNCSPYYRDSFNCSGGMDGEVIAECGFRSAK